MRIRRWFALACLLVFLFPLSSAFAAGDSVALDGIGLRYTPLAGELYVTREDQNAQALSAFGTDSDTLLASMERDGLYLISLQPDGRQVSLGISAKPDGIASAEFQEMTASEKDTFLTQLAREGGYGNATWKSDGYALFSSTVTPESSQTLSYSDLSLCTLYLNRVYSFRMALVGRDATQEDMDLLLSAANRTLRLGASTAAESSPDAAADEQTLTLPNTQVTGDPVLYTYQNQGCDLTLDPVSQVIGVTYFTLSGVTVPEGYLRYAVNGKVSSRIKADESGAFSFTVPNLSGNQSNQIEVTAFKGDLKTSVSFTVTVDWQYAPVSLETVGEIQADTVTLRGVVLPDSSVTLTQGRGSGRITVGADGTFTVTLALPRLGENAFTLRVQTTGYHRSDESFVIVRTQSAQEVLSRLQKQVKTVDYQKLIGNPAAYGDRVVRLQGAADTLAYNGGQPTFILTDTQGNRYLVHCDNLLSVSEGATVEVLGTLTGTLTSSDSLPELDLEALL